MTSGEVSPIDTARDVVGVLRDYRMAQGTERELQAAIEQVLTSEGFDFEREVAISAADRPDFLVAPRVALEVKVKGPVAAVTRQLARYASDPGIDVVVLVTTCMDHVVPQVLEGKPVITLCVNSAFL